MSRQVRLTTLREAIPRLGSNGDSLAASDRRESDGTKLMAGLMPVAEELTFSDANAVVLRMHQMEKRYQKHGLAPAGRSLSQTTGDTPSCRGSLVPHSEQTSYPCLTRGVRAPPTGVLL